MPTYHALIRKISTYSGADVLLGVFHEQLAAEDARERYLARYHPSPQSDPWHEQSYKPEGLAAEDLQIKTLKLESRFTGREVSIVSLYYEGMGQLLRELDSIHSSRASAEERVAEVEATMGAADKMTYDLPSDCIAQILVLDELQSDLPEDQPVT